MFEVGCANGRIKRGARVQTQDDEGDYKWYVGTVEQCYESGQAKVVYDDDDKWTGSANYMYLLPPGHPGLTQKVPMGATTQAGPPGFVNSVGQPVGAQLVAAMQPAHPPIVDAMPTGGAVSATVIAQPIMAPPQPMQPAQPIAGHGMITLTAVAAVAGGQMMQVSGPDGSPMHVQVPQGVQPGQQFSFQVAASDVGAAPVAMGTPMC